MFEDEEEQIQVSFSRRTWWLIRTSMAHYQHDLERRLRRRAHRADEEETLYIAQAISIVATAERQLVVHFSEPDFDNVIQLRTAINRR